MSELSEIDATPDPFSVVVPIVVPPAVKVTVPLGTPNGAVTVAVNVTVAPKFTEPEGDVVTEVFVGA